MTAYADLRLEPAPRMLLEGVRNLGVAEIPGADDNPVIMGWMHELLNHYDFRWQADVMSSDEVPWCGLFMAILAHRAGKEVRPRFLSARDWASWGTPVAIGDAALGDVLIFARGSGGHVGLYVGEDAACYHVLGGNQSNAVTVTRIKRDRLIAVRHQYDIGRPPNCRRVIRTAHGSISENEA